MVKDNANIRPQKKRDILNLALSVIIIILLNYICSFVFYRFDLTSEKRFSLTPGSIQLAKDLDDVVFVKIYLDGDFPGAPGFKRLRDATKELLDEFRAYSGDNIEYEFVDPNAITDKKQRGQLYEQLDKKGLRATNLEVKGEKGVSQQIIFPGAIVTFKGRELPWQLLNTQTGVDPNEQLNNSVQALEYEFSNTIRRLNKGLKPRVAFIDGQREIDSLQIADVALSLSEYYDIERVTINSQLKRLDGLKAVIIARPDSAFDEKDKFIIDQYIMNGGNVLWLIDPVYVSYDSLRKSAATLGLENELNLKDQLFKYGVRINANLIQDLQCSAIPVNKALVGQQPRFELMPWFFSPLIIPTEQHPIVKNLDLIKFDFVSSIDTIKTENVRKTILLKSSRYTKVVNSPVRINLAMVNIRPDENQFRKSFQPVAVLLEGKFESLYKNRIPPSIAKDSAIGFKETGKPAKIIVVSDGDVIRNNVDRNGQPMPLGYDVYTRRMYGNKNFILNCVNWLCDDSGLMSARARDIKLRMLNKKKIVAERVKWQVINTSLPVIFIVILGVVLYFIRKRKYAS
ncbi:MAG: gliding motility-associated ABC transporter substrate-binding protein GldG [Bacteroidia bacterium]|nr:gliding motility-associated ABC transporter substrate-binding protein GldG [Bacteroidia bacterium]